MTVVWSPRAIRHLAELRAYTAHEKPDGAGVLILAAIGRLADFPNLGRPGRVSGTREHVIPGTPYVAAYRPRGERLEIIAVFYGRHRWPRHT